MSALEIILLALVGALLCAAVIIAVLYLRNRRGLIRISENIDRFIAGGEAVQFSTADSSLARMQNSVNDLENLLTLERSNTVAESRKNTDFVADISHQLKTPLAGLRLYCEMEQRAAAAGYTEKELQLIEKMEKLIYNLLRLEKLRSDAYVMDFRQNRLEDIAAELLGEFRHLFPDRRCTLTGSASLRCDKAWLGEAIGNVIKNAGEHTAPNGEININIEQNEKTVILTVEDDGGGLPEEQLPMLFRRFYRTQNSAPGSAGVGLAITRAIVEKHHATVSAENGKRGLRVVMCFPVIDGSLKI